MLSIAFIAAIGSFLLLSCQANNPWNGLIKVAVVLPFTGYDSHTSEDVLASARLAVRDWNSKGGVNGYRVELTALDDENQAQTAAQRAREIVLDGDIIATIGYLSDASATAAAAEYRPSHMPFLTFACPLISSDDSAEGKQLGDLCLGPSDSQLAKTILDKIPLPPHGRVAIVRDEADSSALGKILVGQMQQHDILLVSQPTINRSQRDFKTLIAQISASQADLVVFQGDYRQAATLYTALNQDAPTTRFVAVESDTPDFARVGGTGLAGAMYVSFWPSAVTDSKTAAAFQQQYQAQRGKPATGYASVAYDAVSIVLTAAERGAQGSRPTRESTGRELTATRKFDGTIGKLVFGENGDRVSPAATVYAIGADGSYPGVAVK